MNCSHCGAYLDLPDSGQGVAQCQYCGTETLVQSQNPQAGAHIPQPMAPQQIRQQLQQQQQWAQQQQQWAQHRAQQQAAQIQTQSKSVGIIIAVSTILPLVIAGIVAAVTMTSVSDTVGQATATPAMPAATGSGSSPATATAEPAVPTDWLGKACLVDANGDNVLDLAGLVGERENAKATILDGASGEELWRAGSFADRAYVFCPLEGWIGVASTEDFEVDFFPVEDAEAGHVSRTVSDEPREWGAGDGCVSIRSSDRRTVGIALPEGTETKCGKADNELRDNPGMQATITRDVYRAEHEGVTYTLRERQRGTEFLEVSAKRGGKELWDVPLRVLRAGGGTGVLAMVPTPGTVVVLGSDRKDDDRVSILGLDAKTGVERWSRELPERPAVSFQSLHYNGRYVVYTETWNDEIVAVDPANGEQAWRVGG